MAVYAAVRGSAGVKDEIPTNLTIDICIQSVSCFITIHFDFFHRGLWLYGFNFFQAIDLSFGCLFDWLMFLIFID